MEKTKKTMVEKTYLSIDWEEQSTHLRYIASLQPAPIELSPALFDDGAVILGQFTSVNLINDNELAFRRDPLGISKLFYTEDRSNRIRYSYKYTDLFGYGTDIFSVPAGMHVRVGSGGIRKKVDSIHQSEPYKINTTENIGNFQAKFANRMQRVFTGIRELENNGWTIFIALSGGLDSSIIATNARRYLSDPIACTLDLGKSEDSEKATKIAELLDLDHQVFSTSFNEIRLLLEEAPFVCQDFRDFNVHCAVLNMLLAKKISEFANKQPEIDCGKKIILTGDMMNEYTCDYSSEVIDGKEYYALPDVKKKKLQEFLINGLDTSDRELSPFAKYGLRCIQPFSAVYDLYHGVNESILSEPDPKKLLNAALVEPGIRDLIPKVKLRAQVGDRESMGILGISHRLGLDNRYFRKSLLKSAATDGRIPIFFGKYDMEEFN